MAVRLSPPALFGLALIASGLSCKGSSSQAADAGPAPTPSAPASVAEPPPPPPPGAFEGTIKMRITPGTEPPFETTFLAKGNKLRLDMPPKDGHAAHAILDMGTRKLVVLSDADKTATTSTVPPDGAPPAIKKPGMRERLHARDCEDWDVAEPTGVHESLCVTTGIPFVDFGTLAPALGMPPLGTWMQGLGDERGFPVREVVAGRSGAIDVRAQVVGFDAHPVEDSQFTVPTGYRTKH